MTTKIEVSKLTETLLGGSVLRDGQSFVHFVFQNYLDPITDIIMDPEMHSEAVDLRELKVAARAFAVTIAVMQRNTYKCDPDEVIRRAVIRRKIRLGLIPYELTPGYGYVTWDNDDPTEINSPYRGKPPAGKESPHPELREAKPEKPSKKLSANEAASVKTSLAAGFKPADLAKLYGVPLATIEACRG